MASIPFGLDNLGLTCWFNSMLQALFSCDSFITRIKNIESVNNIRKQDNSVCLQKLYNSYRKKAITYNHINMTGQQDSHEGLMYFYDMYNLDMSQHRYRVTTKCNNCNNKIISFDSNNTIVLPKQCDNIKNYIIKHENKINDYKCELCKSNNVTQTRNLVYASPILCILLPKYSVKTLIEYPNKFIIEGKKIPFNYKLKAVIMHYGDISGGHYTTEAIRDNKWYRFSDTSYNISDGKPKSEAYLLFYERHE